MKKTPSKPKPPQPDLVYVPEDGPPRLFLVRHKPSGTWWGPNEAGYTEALPRAGTYSEAKARELEKRRDGEDEAVPLDQAVREFCGAANPYVLQAIAALGGR